ncbi:hypothetical protein ABZ545_21470 [Streptomyces abikoensis]|uniref:hypothetical protein n=1 Tax=Streptomyces TaxID=1883 RepID=UPI0033F686E6
MTDSNSTVVTGLRQAVTRALPHMEESGFLGGLFLDFDGTALYVVATDRYTMAVGRATVSGTGEPWTAFIERPEACELARFLDRTGYHSSVTLGWWWTEEAPGLRLTTEHREEAVVDCTDLLFPDWRKVVREALDQPEVAAPALLSPALVRRWGAVDEPVSFRFRGSGLPVRGSVIVTAPGFLGLHKPMTYEPGSAGTELADWHEAITDRPKEA